MSDPPRHSREPTGEPMPLVEQAVCPHCWHRFAPHDVLAVARHADLRDDPVAGPEAYLRFLPSRFTVEGIPIDPNGVETRELACPRCHLELSKAHLEMPPLFASIIGAPASGKSYYLAAMTWRMRSLLPGLGWSFSDADPAANARLHASEQKLFLAERPDTPVSLEKTATEGADLYRSVLIDGRPVVLPRPFQFTLMPTDPASRLRRVLVLYDNAGEHFLPGQETGAAPVTEHLARSHVLLFLLDPTQDPRMRARCRGTDPQLTTGPRGAGFSGESVRQEAILSEAAHRVRRSLGLKHGARHKAPLIVVLAKADLWGGGLFEQLEDEPVRPGPQGAPAVDATAMRATHRACRAVLQDVCPEIVSVAESFCRSVFYVPVSSLGGSPELIRGANGDAFMAIRPRDIRPRWVAAPMLAVLRAVDPEQVPTVDDAGLSQPTAAATPVAEAGA
jgi:hypothetical protein